MASKPVTYLFAAQTSFELIFVPSAIDVAPTMSSVFVCRPWCSLHLVLSVLMLGTPLEADAGSVVTGSSAAGNYKVTAVVSVDWRVAPADEGEHSLDAKA